jgi:hypothetical protein
VAYELPVHTGIYSQARIQAKRESQQRVVEMIVSREREAVDVEEPLILAKNATAMALS